MVTKTRYTYHLIFEGALIATYTDCHIDINYYLNSRLALSLENASDGPILDITKNISGVNLQPGEIVVKAYSENEGLDYWLVNNNIATFTDRAVQSGFTTMPIMKLTPQFIQDNQLEI